MATELQEMNEHEQKVIAILDRACKAFNYYFNASPAGGNMLTVYLASKSPRAPVDSSIPMKSAMGEPPDLTIDFGAWPPTVSVQRPERHTDLVKVLERELRALTDAGQAAQPTPRANVAAAGQATNTNAPSNMNVQQDIQHVTGGQVVGVQHNYYGTDGRPPREE